MARRQDFLRVLRRPRLLVRPAVAAGIALAALIVGDALELESRQDILLLGIAVVVCFSISRDPARFAFGVALLMAVGGFHTARVWGRLLEADRTFFGIYRVSETNRTASSHCFMAPLSTAGRRSPDRSGALTSITGRARSGRCFRRKFSGGRSR